MSRWIPQKERDSLVMKQLREVMHERLAFAYEKAGVEYV